MLPCFKAWRHDCRGHQCNTGIACAAIGRALGHPVKIIMPDWMSRERVQLIRCLGAEVVPITREQGGFLGSIRLCEEFAAHNPHVFLRASFPTAPTSLLITTAQGLKSGLNWRRAAFARVPSLQVLGQAERSWDGRFLRERNPRIAIHPVEPLESPTLSTGHKVGTHRIQGISDDFIPDLINFTQLNEVISISTATRFSWRRRSLASLVSASASLPVVICLRHYARRIFSHRPLSL